MAIKMYTLIPPVLALMAAPLMLYVINKVKAAFAGRKGAPVLQPYHDMLKLFRKGATYSRTTTWVFKAGPLITLVSTLLALLMVPLGSCPALLAFPGDFVLLAYLFGLGRFFTVLAALDTGSSFEGMGASREVTFSALAEPAFFLGLAAVARLSGKASLSTMFSALNSHVWSTSAPVLLLVAVALGVILLTENARIPIDDPNTHLELTMIHEVMVLDHSGPEFGAILYGSALKMWIMGAILTGILIPIHEGAWYLSLPVALAGLLGLAVIVGIVESSMARMRLIRVPQLLTSATGLCALALILTLR
jgi:formate hydrogenlyase subunit 4